MSEQEGKTVLVKLTREEARTVRWLQSAQCGPRDSRPMLQGVNRNGSMVACDGYRLHATPDVLSTTDNAPDGTANYGKVPAAGGYVEVTLPEHEYTYPDYHQIMPQGAPVYELAFNPKLLLEAVKGMEGTAMLRVYEPRTGPFEVYGTVEDGPAYALIMPMHLSKEDKRTARLTSWRPGREVPTVEGGE